LNFGIRKDKISVTIKSVGKLINKTKSIVGFQVAGADNQFYQAIAKVEKDGSITVSSKDVKSPVNVRYCFTNDAIPDLFDINGLPLVPFRTDSVPYKP